MLIGDVQVGLVSFGQVSSKRTVIPKRRKQLQARCLSFDCTSRCFLLYALQGCARLVSAVRSGRTVLSIWINLDLFGLKLTMVLSPFLSFQSTPSVLTRISGFQDFIEQGICELSADPPSSCDGVTGAPTISPVTDLPVADPTTDAPTDSPMAGPTTDTPTSSPAADATPVPITDASTSSPVTTVPDDIPAPTPEPPTPEPTLLMDRQADGPLVFEEDDDFFNNLLDANSMPPSDPPSDIESMEPVTLPPLTGPPVAEPVLTVPASASVLVRLLDDSELRKLFRRFLAIDFLDENAIAAYERASTSFYQTNLPDGFLDVSAVSLITQFIDQEGELSTVAQVTAIQTNSVLDLQEELISVVNGNPDSFIAALQANEPDSFADVVNVEAFDPLDFFPASPATFSPVSSEVQIELLAIQDLLDGDAAEFYESATTEFYQNLLPDIYTDIAVTLRDQFLDAQELTTLVQVDAMTSDPLADFQEVLIALINNNEDAFINLLGPEVPFDELVQVNAQEPVLVPVAGDVQLSLFALQEILSGTALEAFESVTGEFYQDFLPSIFTNIEATLMGQFLDAQELTALVQIDGTTFNPNTMLQPLLPDVVNSNQEAYLARLKELGLVLFDNLVSVSASAVPSMAPSMLVNDDPNSGTPSASPIDSDVLVCGGKGGESSKKSGKGSGGKGKKQKGCKKKKKKSSKVRAKKSLKSSSISKSKSSSETLTSDSFSSKSQSSDATKERKLRRGNW